MTQYRFTDHLQSRLRQSLQTSLFPQSFRGRCPAQALTILGGQRSLVAGGWWLPNATPTAPTAPTRLFLVGALAKCSASSRARSSSGLSFLRSLKERSLRALCQRRAKRLVRDFSETLSRAGKRLGGRALKAPGSSHPLCPAAP